MQSPCCTVLTNSACCVPTAAHLCTSTHLAHKLHTRRAVATHLCTSLKSPFSAFSMADCAIQLRSTNLRGGGRGEP